MTNERPPARIGTAERTAAMKALDEHLAAGRLQVEEYGERSALAANASTAPELAALFDDLPAPHPALPGIEAPPLPVLRPPALPAPREPSKLEVWGPRLMALSPFVALALFMITHTWVVFLLIPATAAVLRHNDQYSHRPHRRRDR
jgi:Domain of unknown function (DUF1707)